MSAPAAIEQAARAAGFLVNAAAPDAVRLAPPLVLTGAEAKSFTAALPTILDAAQSAVSVATTATSEARPSATTGDRGKTG